MVDWSDNQDPRAVRDPREAHWAFHEAIPRRGPADDDRQRADPGRVRHHAPRSTEGKLLARRPRDPRDQRAVRCGGQRRRRDARRASGDRVQASRQAHAEIVHFIADAVPPTVAAARGPECGPAADAGGSCGRWRRPSPSTPIGVTWNGWTPARQRRPEENHRASSWRAAYWASSAAWLGRRDRAFPADQREDHPSPLTSDELVEALIQLPARVAPHGLTGCTRGLVQSESETHLPGRTRTIWDSSKQGRLHHRAARGQGRSHALTLAREGADIIAVDVRPRPAWSAS